METRRSTNRVKLPDDKKAPFFESLISSRKFLWLIRRG